MSGLIAEAFLQHSHGACVARIPCLHTTHTHCSWALPFSILLIDPARLEALLPVSKEIGGRLLARVAREAPNYFLQRPHAVWENLAFVDTIAAMHHSLDRATVIRAAPALLAYGIIHTHSFKFAWD